MFFRWLFGFLPQIDSVCCCCCCFFVETLIAFFFDNSSLGVTLCFLTHLTYTVINNFPKDSHYTEGFLVCQCLVLNFCVLVVPMFCASSQIKSTISTTTSYRTHVFSHILLKLVFNFSALMVFFHGKFHVKLNSLKPILCAKLFAAHFFVTVNA